MIEAAAAGELAGDTRLWALYEQAFPADEREPQSVISRGVERGLVEVTRAREHGQTVGFTVVHRLREPTALFLVYLAVVAERRSSGLGRALFGEVDVRSPGGVVWEIDRAELAPSDAERQIRERRQRFFESLGGRVVARDYEQPPINGPAPVPMALMACGAAAEVPTEKLVRALYFEKYAALNGVDPSVLQSLLERRVAP